MVITSKLTGKSYEPSNSTCLWLSNPQQVATYSYYDADVWDDLLDINSNMKKGKIELVFVFEKTQRLKELYRKWNEHNF